MLRISQAINSPIWDWDTPSLQDETDYYNNVAGWTIPGDAQNFGDSGYSWGSSTNYNINDDLHGGTEGDVLWTWDQQYKRYGTVTVGAGRTTANWRSDVLANFKAQLLNALDTEVSGGADFSVAGWGMDHVYGQGLCVIYNDTGDSTILPVLNGIKSRLEGLSRYQTLLSNPAQPMAYWEARAPARWTIVAAYAYQATGDSGWGAIRDAMVAGWSNSTDWEEGGVIANGGGCYFASREQAGYEGGGTAAYDAGRRFHSAFELALAVEGMWRCYVQTGDATLRERLVKIARYVEHYAHDPTWVGPNVGSRFGHQGDGTRWHKDGGDSGSVNTVSADPSYDIALVNTCVIGYKLTGDSALLTRAQVHFSRGNRWRPWGTQLAPITEVHRYVDTVPDTAPNLEFSWNKGQLQYCYMLFENGGVPGLVA